MGVVDQNFELVSIIVVFNFFFYGQALQVILCDCKELSWAVVCHSIEAP